MLDLDKLPPLFIRAKRKELWVCAVGAVLYLRPCLDRLQRLSPPKFLQATTEFGKLYGKAITKQKQIIDTVRITMLHKIL